MSLVVTDEGSSTGFVTAWLVSLPRALSTLIGVVLLCISLGTLVVGARLLGIGTGWRRRNQSSNDEPGWLRGGMGGVIFGGIAGGVIAAALLLLILSHQDEPRLNRWATFAILILPALALAAGGGRWQTAATICLSLLGAIFFISLALLLAFTHWPRTQLFAIPITAALCAAHLFVLAVDSFTHSGFVDGTSLLVSRRVANSLLESAHESQSPAKQAPY
ncbi:hypothetical protein RHOSPDRAFT_36634 [Rhodotorula sp. JG-1b]|nr:hypothetical protein RHOSPDRAFT_36634 [Rhodotorula sp. JG-1b]